MKWQIIYFVTIIICCCSCKNDNSLQLEADNRIQIEKSYFISLDGDTIATGISLPMIKGDTVAISDLPKPQVINTDGYPTSVNIEPNNQFTKYPESKGIIGNRRYATPGLNGWSLPDTLQVLDTVLLPVRTKPIKAGNLKMGENVRFNIQHLSVKEGLPDFEVFKILMDKDQNIWMTLQDGYLTKYDGTHLTHYSSPRELTDFFIAFPSLIQDKHGNLWFGTKKGIAKFDGLSFQYFYYEDSYKSRYTYSLIEDQMGNIWFGSVNNGLFRFDGKSFIHFTDKSGLSGNSIRYLFEDSKGHIWIGTNNGVNVYNSVRFERFNVLNGLAGDFIKTIDEDKQGNIWIGTDTGISKYDGIHFTNYTQENGLTTNNITSIYCDESNKIWIGTIGEGIHTIDDDNLQMFSKYAGLDNVTINTFMQDEEGNMWIGIWEGLYKIGLPKFNYIDKNIDHATVMDLVEDKNGEIWFSTLRNGLFSLSGNEIKSYNAIRGFPKKGYHDLQFDPYSNSILLRINNQLYQYRDHELSLHRISNLNSERLEFITTRNSGAYWLGTVGSFALRQDSIQISYPLPPSSWRNFADFIMDDSHGNTWISHRNYLLRLEKDSCTFYTRENGLIDDFLGEIIEDSQGNIWIAAKGGLICYNGSHFQNFSSADGIINDKIQSIDEDQNGNIWLGTQNGISVLSPKSVKSANRPKALQDLYNIYSFTHEDGLKNTHIGYHSSLIDQQNRIWWGFSKGAFYLDLKDFHFPDKKPVVNLSHIDINSEYLDQQYIKHNDALAKSVNFQNYDIELDSFVPFYNYPANIKLPFALNHITFHLTATDWQGPHHLKYSYKVNGLEEEWTKPEKNGIADFRNIPPGDYTLRARAIGAANQWSDEYEYAFTILPPWWRTNFAYITYVIAGLGFLYLFYRYLLGRWKLKHRLDLEKERLLKLQEMDAFKNKIFANISHEFRTPLTVIKGIGEQINGNERSKILIKRNADRLLDMVNQILDLSKIESNALSVNLKNGDILPYLKFITESCHSLAEYKNINLAFFSPEEHIVMDFDEIKIQQILINLLTNAIKFTPDYGSVKVFAAIDYYKSNKVLFIQVEDTGKGISQQDIPLIFDRFYQSSTDKTSEMGGTGIGLSLVKELIQLLGGEIQVQSQLDKGTTFIVQLPIQHQAEEVFDLKLEEADQDGSIDKKTNYAFSKSVPQSYNGHRDVLVVEDNADVAEYISLCLKTQYRITNARNGKEGLKKALDIVPDMIICDVMMPEMNGFEFCEQIKTDFRTSHIPVIMLTAKASDEARIKGLQSGADGYLTKPFNNKELLLRMSNLFSYASTLKDRINREMATDINHVQRSNPESAFIEQLNNIISENLSDESFSTMQLCQKMTMSRTQLHRKLKALTGMSTASYIRQMRMEKARSLLLTTQLSVGEISTRVGFKDFSHFSRTFSKTYGENPSESRK